MKITIKELLKAKKEQEEMIRKFGFKIRKWDIFREEAQRKLDNINEKLQERKE